MLLSNVAVSVTLLQVICPCLTELIEQAHWVGQLTEHQDGHIELPDLWTEPGDDRLLQNLLPLLVIDEQPEFAADF